MGKSSFVFLAVCLMSIVVMSSAKVYGHSPSKTISYETHHVPAVQVQSTVDADEYFEIYQAFANGAFDFFAKLVRSKAEIMLWLKRVIFNFLIRGFSYLRHHLVHNADFINGIIHTFAELLKILLTSKPHFAVPHVNRIMAEAENDYIPRGPY